MSKQSLKSCFRLLELLKYHTDKNHPITQVGLRKILGEEASKDIMGDKGTYARRLKQLADAYNTDSEGNVLPKSQWQIVYPGYGKDEESNQKNGKVYFSHPVSDTEMNFLIQQIRATDNFTTEEKKSLEERLKNALCSKHYEYPPEGPVELITECVPSDNYMPHEDKDELLKNISILRDHISSKKMVEMYVDDMNTSRVSPYRILRRHGYYWLIGNCHMREPVPSSDRRFPWYTDALTAYRIDLLSCIKTAHTLDATYIHWMMTKHLLPTQSYTRISTANRETKARYNEDIFHNLSKLEHMDELPEFVHGEDIK